MNLPERACESLLSVYCSQAAFLSPNQMVSSLIPHGMKTGRSQCFLLIHPDDQQCLGHQISMGPQVTLFSTHVILISDAVPCYFWMYYPSRRESQSCSRSSRWF